MGTRGEKRRAACKREYSRRGIDLEPMLLVAIDEIAVLLMLSLRHYWHTY